MIQFKRLTSESTTNIDDVTLKSGQPAIDLKNQTLYVGSTETADESTSKLKFYDGDHVDNKLVNKVTVKESNTESYIYPTTGNITFIQGSNVTLTSDTANKTITIASSYTNTAHTHTSGVGLVKTGDDDEISGTVDYKVALASETLDLNAAVSRPAANANRTYPVIADKNGKLATIVPWINTDTTYSAGSNITLYSNAFSLSTNITGVDSIKCKTITSTGDIETTGGTITAQSFNAKSDRRLKENIIDYKPEKSILDLPIKKFDFIDGPKNQIGCIAQDLKEICPEIVHEDKDGYLSIEESKIVYLLLDEVKKLKAQIIDLMRD